MEGRQHRKHAGAGQQQRAVVHAVEHPDSEQGAEQEARSETDGAQDGGRGHSEQREDAEMEQRVHRHEPEAGGAGLTDEGVRQEGGGAERFALSEIHHEEPERDHRTGRDSGDRAMQERVRPGRLHLSDSFPSPRDRRRERP